MRIKWGHKEDELTLQCLSMKALLAFRLNENKLTKERLRTGKMNKEVYEGT